MPYSIRIAIAGRRCHNNLPKLDTDGRIDKILNTLQGTLDETEDLNIQFLTGLADGADQVITEMVCQYPFLNNKGQHIKPHLDAILPFSVACFKNHPKAKIDNETRFETLLKKCDRIICVNDKATSERVCKEHYPEIQRAADRGYEAQALLMLRRCDVLLAVADPKQEITAPGTLNTVNRARAYHIPVIFVSLGADDGIYILDDETSPYETVDLIIARNEKTANAAILLQKLFARIVAGQIPVYPAKGDNIDYELIAYSDQWTDVITPSIWERLRACFWNSVNTTLKQRVQNEDAIKSGSKARHKTLVGNFIRCLTDAFFTKHEEQTRAKQKKNKIGAMLDNADGANGFFSSQYRGGFILNNLLAIIAVFIAILSLLLILFAVRLSFSDIIIFAVLLLALTVFKLGVIHTIDKNSKLGQSKNWNEKSIQTRYLAERLRVFEYLYDNGILRGVKPSLGKHLNESFQGAPPEAIYRKIEGDISIDTREDGGGRTFYLTPATSLKRLNDVLVAGQVGFHTQGSKRMNILNEALELGGKKLNKATIWLVITDIVILAISLTLEKTLSEDSIKECYWWVRFAHSYITPVFIGITALLPALVAAYNAIRFQTEARKLKDRYGAMKELLAKKSDKIKKALEQAHPDGSQILEFFPLIAEVEQIMLDEVSDWSILYSKEFMET